MSIPSRVERLLALLALSSTLGGACGSSKPGAPAAGVGGSSGPGTGGNAGTDAGTSGNPGVGGNAGNGVDGGSTAGAGGAAGTGEITGQPTTDQVIDAAVAKGLLDAEMGLVYKVYAVFGDPRLPAEYRGVDGEQIDSPIMVIAAQKYPTLSAATQALLLPFFIPPIYAQSWYASRLPPLPFQNAPDGTGASGASDGTGTTDGDTLALEPPDLLAKIFCILIDTTGIAFNETVTPHFRIHAATGNYAYGGEAETAKIVADNAETVYSAVTGAFGRVPPSDLGVSASCNGGDAKLDIYVTAGEIKPGTKAVTIAYNGCGSPSFIIMKAGSDPKKIRNTLAHEFFHTLELGDYKFSAACDDYQWLGEATANLCMDLSFKDDQVEHDDFARYFAFGERMAPIDEPYKNNVYRSNGYADYVFLQYLARKFGTAAVKAIWDGTESADSVHALATAVDAQGGLKNVWPEFALASWNDDQAMPAGAFYGYDSFKYGIKKAFDEGDAGRESGQKSVKVDLKGAPRKTFDLLGSAPSAGGGKELPRLSIQADYFKFTDDTVRSVMFLNTLGLADIPELKVQAIPKLGGQWKAPEDWTKVGSKMFCRDKKDERLEELVVIFSNGDGRRPQQAIPFNVVPKLAVSNVGCWRWEGTSSVNADGQGSLMCSASGLAFERDRAAQIPNFDGAQETFKVVSGQVTGKQVVDFGACRIETSASGAVVDLDGDVLIDLDLDLGLAPPTREVLSGNGSSTLPTPSQFICPTMTTASNGDSSWSWLQIPAGKTVSADGASIDGTSMETSPAGTTTSTWKLTAIREP
jgi:hypothetical protein